MSKPAPHHKADEKALLDDRGYSGTLIRGQNPALLFEKGVRDRIIDSYYWKEQCFGLNAATLCDRAAELKFIGGTSGVMGKPTPFLCLAFKLLQLVPPRKIILEYLNFKDDDAAGEEEHDAVKAERNEDEDAGFQDAVNGGGAVPDLNAQGKLGEFKYLRCLAAFYIRLAWEPVDIYKTLEPLLTDYRKIKRRTKDGFALTYVDQFVDDLLTKDRICATSLWKLKSRGDLEDLDLLEPRVSPIADEVEDMDEGSDGDVEILERQGDSDASSSGAEFAGNRRRGSRSSEGEDRERNRSRDRDSDIDMSEGESRERNRNRDSDSPEVQLRDGPDMEVLGERSVGGRHRTRANDSHDSEIEITGENVVDQAHTKDRESPKVQQRDDPDIEIVGERSI